MKKFKLICVALITLSMLAVYTIGIMISNLVGFALFLLISLALAFLVVEVSHQTAQEDFEDEKEMTVKEIRNEIEAIQNKNMKEYTPMDAKRLNTLRKELFYKRVQPKSTNQVA